MSKTQKTSPEHTQTRFLPKRIDKTLDWLEQSRDIWKDKCLVAKLELKKKTLSVKRLRDARDKWKQQVKQVVKIVQQLKNEYKKSLADIEKLKQELAIKNSEIEALKKKS